MKSDESSDKAAGKADEWQISSNEMDDIKINRLQEMNHENIEY